MKSSLWGIAGIVVSAIFLYLIWLLLFFVTPYVMGINSWILAIILYLVVAPIFIFLISNIGFLLSIPIVFFSSKTNIFFKIIITILSLFCFISIILMPFQLEMKYTFLKILLSVYVIGISIGILSPIIINIWNKND